jgi:hypothetical protein
MRGAPHALLESGIFAIPGAATFRLPDAAERSGSSFEAHPSASFGSHSLSTAPADSEGVVCPGPCRPRRGALGFHWGPSLRERHVGESPLFNPLCSG